MKANLKDTTFIIAVRLDSVYRLENLLAVTRELCRHFDARVLVIEAASWNNGILQKTLDRKVTYRFVEDKDPVFYRTRLFNRATECAATPYIALWDSDVVIDKEAILEAARRLRSGEADVVYPYNGIFYETSEMVRTLYLKKRTISVLYRHKNKLPLLYNRPMVGGAIFLDREKYMLAGMENETHYGWGNDDFDRYYRFVNLGFTIRRTSNPLFHLYHPRGDNSRFRSSLSEQISTAERLLLENSSREETINHILSKSQKL